MIREVKAGGGGCSSLRVLGGGWVTMKTHGVEISIAGGVVEMVRGPTPRRFFFFFFFFFSISCALISSSRYKNYVQR